MIVRNDAAIPKLLVLLLWVLLLQLIAHGSDSPHLAKIIFESAQIDTIYRACISSWQVVSTRWYRQHLSNLKQCFVEHRSPGTMTRNHWENFHSVPNLDWVGVYWRQNPRTPMQQVRTGRRTKDGRTRAEIFFGDTAEENGSQSARVMLSRGKPPCVPNCGTPPINR